MVPDESTPLTHSISADQAAQPSRTREGIVRRYTEQPSSARIRVNDHARDEDGHFGDHGFEYGENDSAPQGFGEATTADELAAEERGDRTWVGNMRGFGRKHR